MGIETYVKGLMGGIVGYAAAALLFPYYAPYATAARIVGTSIGVYAASNSGSKNSAHGHASAH